MNYDELKQSLVRLKNKYPERYRYYLDEILEDGYFDLLEHFIAMKNILGRWKSEALLKMSLSTVSHVVLQTMIAIIEKINQNMPSDWYNYSIFFLLGNESSGKSTIFSFLRGDKIILEDNYYVSESKNNIDYPKFNSHTFLPNIGISPNQNIILVDFPEFDYSDGIVISLGIELALKTLINIYNPTILVIDSIVNPDSLAELSHYLNRVFLNKNDCILCLTNYTRSFNFFELKNIEKNQLRELSKTSSNEEMSLKGRISILEPLVAQIPNLEAQILNLKEKLSFLQERENIFDLPDTEEKRKYRELINIKESEILKEIGLQHLIGFYDLEKPESLNYYLGELKSVSELYSKVKIPPKISEYTKDNFNQIFISTLNETILPNRHYPLDFHDFAEFKQDIVKKSLIDSIMPYSPEIGEFLHLPEMDASFVKSLDLKLIKNRIRNYTTGIIGMLRLTNIDIRLSRLNKILLAEILREEILAIKFYLLKSKGFVNSESKIKDFELEWEKLEIKYEHKSKNEKKTLDDYFRLGYWETIGIESSIGIPTATVFLGSYSYQENIGIKILKEYIQTSISEIKQLHKQHIHLVMIKKIIEAKII